MGYDAAGSITQWIAAARDGNEEAFRHLWEHVCGDLKRAAKARLSTASRSVADEDDAFLSAFADFWKSIVDHKYPDVIDRHDLRALLLVITIRKAIKQSLHENRLKRGGGKVKKGLTGETEDSIPEALAHSNPELTAMVADEQRHLLAVLGNDDLRQVAGLYLEGCTIDEIAEQVNRTRATVYRRLELIRARWLLEQGDSATTG